MPATSSLRLVVMVDTLHCTPAALDYFYKQMARRGYPLGTPIDFVDCHSGKLVEPVPLLWRERSKR